MTSAAHHEVGRLLLGHQWVVRRVVVRSVWPGRGSVIVDICSLTVKRVDIIDLTGILHTGVAVYWASRRGKPSIPDRIPVGGL